MAGGLTFFYISCMGLGFRVGRGVRLYAGGRGLGVSVGTGPVRYYTRLGGGGRSGRTSVTAYERQVRQTQRVQEIQSVIDLDNQLIEMCLAHTGSFPLAERPTAPPPESVSRREVRSALVAEATAKIPLLRVRERRSARRAALAGLDSAVLKEDERRAQELREHQAQLDDQWARLQANDPATVLAALEAAFEDNEAPAAAVSCREDRVDIVLRWPQLNDVVPERKAGATPTGRPTIRKRSKSERSEFYLEALCSHSLATVREAFAECSAIQEVGLAVIRTGRDPARGDDIVETLFLATMRREKLASIRWESVVAIAALLENATGRVGLRGKGANKALFGLDLEADQEARAFIGDIANALGARVADGGVPGLPLPVNVVVAT